MPVSTPSMYGTGSVQAAFWAVPPEPPVLSEPPVPEPEDPPVLSEPPADVPPADVPPADVPPALVPPVEPPSSFVPPTPSSHAASPSTQSLVLPEQAQTDVPKAPSKRTRRLVGVVRQRV